MNYNIHTKRIFILYGFYYIVHLPLEEKDKTEIKDGKGRRCHWKQRKQHQTLSLSRPFLINARSTAWCRCWCFSIIIFSILAKWLLQLSLLFYIEMLMASIDTHTQNIFRDIALSVVFCRFLVVYWRLVQTQVLHLLTHVNHMEHSNKMTKCICFTISIRFWQPANTRFILRESFWQIIKHLRLNI